MKFKLDTEIPDFKQKITYSQNLFFLGSCFSTEISSKFDEAGFVVTSNPTGTIFHPIAIANYLKNLIENKHIYLGFNDNEQDPTPKDFLPNLSINEIELPKLKNDELHQEIINCSHLFITLGTSFGYRDKKTQEIVPNCEKRPTTDFNKELSSVEEMLIVWKDALQVFKQVNSKAKVVFTVSPVRHTKDGLKENNRSKARLFELITQLELVEKISYLPVYEIVNDELRDYRFFKEDLIHPNALAISYVWEQLKPVFFDTKILILVHEVEQLRKLQKHDVRSSSPAERNKFEMQRTEKIKAFQIAHPEVNL